MANPESGQALIELSFSIWVLLALIYTGAKLLFGEWQSVQCSVLAFEAAHNRLISEAFHPAGRYTVRIQEDASKVTVQAQCGELAEEVSLPRLEAVP